MEILTCFYKLLITGDSSPTDQLTSDCMHRIINLKVNHFKVSILGLLVLLGSNQAQVDNVQVVLPQVSRQAKDLSRVIDVDVADEVETKDVETEVLGLDEDDERVEKSLLNTFPFNQHHGDDQHQHGE